VMKLGKRKRKMVTGRRRSWPWLFLWHECWRAICLH